MPLHSVFFFKFQVHIFRLRLISLFENFNFLHFPGSWYVNGRYIFGWIYFYFSKLQAWIGSQGANHIETLDRPRNRVKSKSSQAHYLIRLRSFFLRAISSTDNNRVKIIVKLFYFFARTKWEVLNDQSFLGLWFNFCRRLSNRIREFLLFVSQMFNVRAVHPPFIVANKVKVSWFYLQRWIRRWSKTHSSSTGKIRNKPNSLYVACLRRASTRVSIAFKKQKRI